MDDILIRAAKKSDAAELLEIYSHYVKNTAVSFEWEPPSLSEFEERIEQTLESRPWIIAEVGGNIAGYAYTSAFNKRIAYSWTEELSIYIRAENRRGGIGCALFEQIEKIELERGISNLESLIAVPRGNDPHLSLDSIFFHEKVGFRKVGEFQNCGYKFNRWYNMAIFEKEIAPHKTPAEFPAPFKSF